MNYGHSFGNTSSDLPHYSAIPLKVAGKIMMGGGSNTGIHQFETGIPRDFILTKKQLKQMVDNHWMDECINTRRDYLLAEQDYFIDALIKQDVVAINNILEKLRDTSSQLYNTYNIDESDTISSFILELEKIREYFLENNSAMRTSTKGIPNYGAGRVPMKVNMIIQK